MNIAATDLKHALKRLSGVKTETYQISETFVSAQDSDAWVVVDCPLSGLGPAFNIAGKKLSQTVARMSSQVEITREDKKLTLRSAKARIELEIQPAKTSTLPRQPDKVLLLPAVEFKQALALAASSASPAKSAPFGGCVQFQSQALRIEYDLPQGYRITGTDGIILTTVNTKAELPFEFRMLLNLTAASIVQLMDGPQIEIGETNTHLKITSGGTTVYASKPVQAYPNYDSLLAAAPHTKLSFLAENLLSVLRTVEPMVDESVDQGAVALHFKDGVVQCLSGGVGSTAQDETVYEQTEPDPIFEPREVRMKLNVKYLSSFLSKAKGPAVLSITNKPVWLASGNMLVLTMPMLTKEKK
jgi:DNA polymerase III sliding clamp (beta) subunit (PCNA family)